MAISLRNPPVPIWRNRRVQALIYQGLFLVVALALGYAMVENAMENLRARGVVTGFGFLQTTSSFVISETVPLPVVSPQTLQTMLALLATWVVLLALRRRLAAKTQLGFGRWWCALAALLAAAALAAAIWVWAGDLRFINYTVPGTYGVGLLTGFGNTVKIAVVAILLSLVLGLAIGLCRLSQNWLVSRSAAFYLDLVRNVPLLLVIFFWYFGVLRTLPSVRNSINLGGVFVLNNRGVIVPEPGAEAGLSGFLASCLVLVVALVVYARHVRRVQERTGRRLPMALPALIALVAAPSLAWIAFGAPLHWTLPQLHGFNFEGGLTVTPEYASLLVALVIYTSAFISEIVRSAVLAIPAEQTEAGLSLGLSPWQVLWLVVLPQARRVAIPPATATCLGLIKDTSLGVAIGYPELVSVGGTILDVSGHALEVIAITVAFYMSLTLLFSAFMSWYYARVQLPQR